MIVDVTTTVFFSFLFYQLRSVQFVQKHCNKSERILGQVQNNNFNNSCSWSKSESNSKNSNRNRRNLFCSWGEFCIKCLLLDNKEGRTSFCYLACDVPTVYSDIPMDLEWSWLGEALAGLPPPPTGYATDAMDKKLSNSSNLKPTEESVTWNGSFQQLKQLCPCPSSWTISEHIHIKMSISSTATKLRLNGNVPDEKSPPF